MQWLESVTEYCVEYWRNLQWHNYYSVALKKELLLQYTRVAPMQLERA
jgi:hypothetical protein